MLQCVAVRCGVYVAVCTLRCVRCGVYVAVCIYRPRVNMLRNGVISIILVSHVTHMSLTWSCRLMVCMYCSVCCCRVLQCVLQCMNESCHTYQAHLILQAVSCHTRMIHATHIQGVMSHKLGVMSQIWICHVTHQNASCHTHECVMSRIWISLVTHLNESCQTFEWVMSHIWMSHVTHMNKSCHTFWMCHIRAYKAHLITQADGLAEGKLVGFVCVNLRSCSVLQCVSVC